MSLINATSPQNYVIAIPSYGRPAQLEKRTLTMLKSHQIDPKKIFIFVANEQEKKRYEDVLLSRPFYYGQLVVAELGICQVRNFIEKYFPKNTPVLCIDDDVKYIYSLNENSRSTIKNLNGFIITAFELAIQHSSPLWGIRANDDVRSMKWKITQDLQFNRASFFGFVAQHDEKLLVNPQLTLREDYDRSIKYFKAFGKVIRFHFIGQNAKYAEGVKTESEKNTRREQLKQQTDLLVELEPNYCELRKSGLISNRDPYPIGLRNVTSKLKPPLLASSKEAVFSLFPQECLLESKLDMEALEAHQFIASATSMSDLLKLEEIILKRLKATYA